MGGDVEKMGIFASAVFWSYSESLADFNEGRRVCGNLGWNSNGATETACREHLLERLQMQATSLKHAVWLAGQFKDYMNKSHTFLLKSCHLEICPLCWDLLWCTFLEFLFSISGAYNCSILWWSVLYNRGSQTILYWDPPREVINLKTTSNFLKNTCICFNTISQENEMYDF